MTSPLDDVRVFAERIQRSIGGPIERKRNEFRVLCPEHEADGRSHRPSLAIWDACGRVAFKCMSVCPWPDVRKALSKRGIAIPGAPSSADRRHSAAEQEAHRAAQREIAWALLEQGAPLVPGDPAWRYLAGRSIPLQDHELADFRMIRRSPGVERLLAKAMGKLPPDWHGNGSLFAAPIVETSRWRDNAWQEIGVQLTFLNADGVVLKERGKTTRRTIGQRSGAGVVVGKYCATVLVGEGTETVLSAMSFLELPFGIATLGALDQLHLPAFCTHVVISVDADDAGEEAAERARKRWQCKRRTVTLQRWGERGSGVDANDVLLAGYRGCAFDANELFDEGRH
jgi:hypothetical protein